MHERILTKLYGTDMQNYMIFSLSKGRESDSFVR